MISILLEYVKGRTFKGDKGTCEDILYIIEQAGMTPPRRIPKLTAWEPEE